MTDFQTAYDTGERLRAALSKIIRGRDDTIRLILTGLLADGHVLLEDYPGSGKTTLSKSLGNLIENDQQDPSLGYILPFRRIQFTPDMLPGDVLGVNIFEAQSGTFRFLHGPVFAHVVLADELNRTGPKVQAAFLECMAEKQVTIDNMTYPLDALFFVIGTQNPLDIAGTYPLPLVQLDRFLLKVPMSYVDPATEINILENHREIVDAVENISPVCTRTEVLHARNAAGQVHLSTAIREAIVDIVQTTRNTPLVQYGASTRAALMLQSALKAWSLLNGRDYVNEDDLKYLAPFVLVHRLRFHGTAANPTSLLQEIMVPAMEKLIRRAL